MRKNSFRRFYKILFLFQETTAKYCQQISYLVAFKDAEAAVLKPIHLTGFIPKIV